MSKKSIIVLSVLSLIIVGLVSYIVVAKIQAKQQTEKLTQQVQDAKSNIDKSVNSTIENATSVNAISPEKVVDKSLPYVSLTNPVNGATDVKVNGRGTTNLTIEFSDFVKPITPDISYITVFDDKGNRVMGLSWGGRSDKYIFPTDYMKPGEKYTIKIGKFEDDKGNISEPYTFSFTTLNTFDNSLIQEIKGAWMNKSYIDKIKSSKSVYSATYAMRSEQILSFGIVYNDGNWVLNGTMDNHQGYPGGQIKEIYKKASNVISIDFGENGRSIDLIYINKDNLRLSEQDIEYMHVGTTNEANEDMDKYIGKILFTGEYISENGENYSFDDNAQAIFNGRKFKYNLNFDSSFTRCDYITDVTSKDINRYAFEFKNNKLYLYKAGLESNGEVLSIIDKKPIAILTKIK